MLSNTDFKNHLNSVWRIDCKKHRELSVRKREKSTNIYNSYSSSISHCRKIYVDRSQLVIQCNDIKYLQ